jgi:hypothetical protein
MFTIGRLMKTVKLIYILSILMLDFSVGFAQKKETTTNDFRAYRTLDINNINMNLNNVGDFRVSIFNDHPTKWIQMNNTYYGNTIVYAQGLWVVGKINNEIHLTRAQWISHYSPGPIFNEGPAMLVNPQDSLRYRVYKITKGDDPSNPDYADWPSDLGAPVIKWNRPFILEDQTLWTVYNGLDSTLEALNWGFDTSPPTPIEVQQFAYARKGNYSDGKDIFSNVVFFEWTVINRGSQEIDSAFIGFWTDIDFFRVWHNPPGVDIPRQLGYCWYDEDPLPYEGIPPAVGYTLLYGPVIPSPGETAVFRGRKKNNYRNLTMTSFHGIRDDSITDPFVGPMRRVESVWNVAKGLDGDGNPIIDPLTGEATPFPFSGDPVTNTGWIYPENRVEGGAGFALFSGPFDMAPGDTQWVMMALVPGLGNDRFESITVMREKTDILQSLPYDSLVFGSTPYIIERLVKEEEIPECYQLSQNYPNPFNTATTMAIDLPESGEVSLKIFNLLGQEIENLVSGYRKAGIYPISWNANDLPSGVYLARLQAGDFVDTKKLVLQK